MNITVNVAGLALDEKSKSPIVVLKDETGSHVLPIVIGIMEASAIAACLEGVDFPRPMTHDLVTSIIKEMGGAIEEIEICDLINDTFYALLHVRVGDKLLKIDARPSDSIALALRADARITVAKKVLEATSQSLPKEAGGQDLWQEVLESMEDDDFGKYKM
jgi:uncharacterized protein